MCGVGCGAGTRDARGGNRTRTASQPWDFKSHASASSATRAQRPIVRDANPLETATDAELENRERIELAIRELPVNGKLDFRLHVDALPHHYSDAGAGVNPITAADQHGNALETILFAVQPVGTRVGHDAMGAHRVRPAARDFPRRPRLQA